MAFFTAELQVHFSISPKMLIDAAEAAFSPSRRVTRRARLRYEVAVAYTCDSSGSMPLSAASARNRILLRFFSLIAISHKVV